MISLTNNMLNSNPIDYLNTGDLLFCYEGDNDVWYDITFNDQRYSPYKRIGIIVKNPNFTNFKITGLYVLEMKENFSGCKGKAILTAYEDFTKDCKRIDARCWANIPSDSLYKFSHIYDDIIAEPYYYCLPNQIGKCLEYLGCSCCKVERSEKFFWNGELIAYIFLKMKLFKPTKPLAMYTIHDFSEIDNRNLYYNLGKIFRIV